MGDIDRASLVYRWDLDKTYLHTEFDTVRDLLNTAFETPASKRTVPGASALLRELRTTEPAGIYILSGSPEQMRRVLEAKLRLDGIMWDAFTLKPSLRNLMRGKVRYLKDQVSYKLAALLTSRTGVAPDTMEVLFGDDAEADAFIYSLYADICGGRVGDAELMEVLALASVYPEDIAPLVRLAHRIPRRETVRRIYIHLERVSSPAGFQELGRRVCPFFNYFQPALVLVHDGMLDAPSALRVGAELVLEHGFNPEALIASFMDLQLRGYVGRTVADQLLEGAGEVDPHGFLGAAPVVEAFAEALAERLGDLGEPPPFVVGDIDYSGLFPRDRARALAGKLRAKWRRH